MSRPWKPDNRIQMAQVFSGEGRITNLDFHRNGKLLLITTNESSLHLIDVLSATEKKKIYTKSYGIKHATFTHHETCVLLTNEKKSNEVRYLSLYDNKYLRFFSGHNEKITSLSMNPIEDNFITSSNDKTVCIWNISVPTPIAKLSLPYSCERPYSAYDTSGLIFGVLCYDNSIRHHSLRLFDSRSYERGPFQEIIPSLNAIENSVKNMKDSSSITHQQSLRSLQSIWSSFEFSPDGQRILVNTTSDLVLVFDSFNTEVEPTFIFNRKNDSGVTLGTCFSADGQFIVSGNDDNEIQVFEVATGDLKHTFSGHVAPVSVVRCNPRYSVMASGCVNTALWI